MRAGCSKVRTLSTCPLSQTHRQDWLQYTAPQLASMQCNNKTIHDIKKHIDALFHLVFVEIISSTQIGVLRGTFLANHLSSTDN